MTSKSNRKLMCKHTSARMPPSELPSKYLDTSMGDTSNDKSANFFRFAFNNINGLALTSSSLQEFVSVTQDLQLYWIGLVKTHLDSTIPHVREAFKSAMRSAQGFPAVNCAFAASDVNFGMDRKRGGVLQMAVNNLATRTIAQYSDPYGRFTSQTHTGRNGTLLLTTISAYRVGETSQGPASAHAQQRVMLVTKNRQANPTAVFFDDMIEYIQACQLKGHNIILCLDANETLQKTKSGLWRLLTTCSLLDIHEAIHPHMALPSHQRGSGKINFILVSPRVLTCVTRAGILPMDGAYGSDHRLLFIDADIIKCFHGTTADPVSICTRSFTTKNKKRTDIFRKAIQQEWTQHKMSKRIMILTN